MKYISVTQALSPFVDFSNVPADRLQYAADRGTLLHSAFAAYALDLWVPPMPADHEGYFLSFKNWFDQYVKRVIWVEKELTCNKFFFVGHPDALVELVSDERVLIDYKTPAQQQPTWRAQLAAYGHLSQVLKTMSIQLKADGKAARATVYTHRAADFAAFLSALNAYRYFKA